MVYDVETCEHECEVTRLKRELAQANSALSEYQQRESELIQERQQVRLSGSLHLLHGATMVISVVIKLLY